MLLVRDLKDRYDEGENVKLSLDEVDVHSVASLLKQYLRELPECLIPYKFYQEFMNIAMKFQGTKSDGNKLELVDSLKTAVVDLPCDSYCVLKALCNFLRKVSNKTDINKMSPQNLARVFGPNIIRHPQMEDNPEVFMLTTADISEQLAYMMINYDDKIFTIEFDSNTCAVDDLLQLEDDISAPGDILTPMPGKPVPSGIDELSDIVFEQRRDRRARSFQSGGLMLNITNSIDFSGSGSAETSPTINEQPPSVQNIEKKPTVSADGKPIPPLRRKYTRKHQNVSAQRSDDSVSSDQSSENSVESTENRNSFVNLPPTPNTALLELQQRLETMTAEHNNLKARYDNLNASKTKSDERVKNLSAEMSKIQARYEVHIRNMETRHKVQIDDMNAKLAEEKTSKAEAVKKIVDLQKTLQKYQMHYGDLKDKLPPLYQ